MEAPGKEVICPRSGFGLGWSCSRALPLTFMTSAGRKYNWVMSQEVTEVRSGGGASQGLQFGDVKEGHSEEGTI